MLDAAELKVAVADQDIVYANLAGDVDVQATAIIAAMKEAGTESSSSARHSASTTRYQEIGEYFPPYRKAADLIEASGLDYAILRPAWLTDAEEMDFETTERGEPFKVTEVSRRSVAAVVAQLAVASGPLSNRNIGINKPGTDGDKPAFL